jgi:putative acetyltransferase
MSNFTFRSAEQNDAEAVARLHHLTRETSMPYLPALHTLDEGIVFFSTVIDQRTVLVTELDGAIVGYCAYGDGWLDHLYVHPDLQGQGIGSELLNRAITDSDSLQLWVFQRNSGAIRFYERFGFKLVRQTDGAENEEREPDALYAL